MANRLVSAKIDLFQSSGYFSRDRYYSRINNPNLTEVHQAYWAVHDREIWEAEKHMGQSVIDLIYKNKKTDSYEDSFVFTVLFQ